MDQGTVKNNIAQGTGHLHFIIGLYQIQLDNGRHFLHEHPEGGIVVG